MEEVLSKGPNHKNSENPSIHDMIVESGLPAIREKDSNRCQYCDKRGYNPQVLLKVCLSRLIFLLVRPQLNAIGIRYEPRPSNKCLELSVCQFFNLWQQRLFYINDLV